MLLFTESMYQCSILISIFDDLIAGEYRDKSLPTSSLFCVDAID